MGVPWSLLKRQLYRDLLSTSNLRQLLILQQVSSPNVVIGEVEHLGQMKLPPDLDFKYVLADCSGTVIKPGQELRCPGYWNHLALCNLERACCYSTKSVEWLADISFYVHGLKSLKYLCESFP